MGSSNATLNAQIDPNGVATSYYWEYGPSEAYGSRTPAVSLGEGESASPAPAHLEGLAANSEYHFRVVAVSEAGTEHGADTTFRTLPVSPLGLPDGRVYERVSSFGSAQNGTAQVYTPECTASNWSCRKASSRSCRFRWLPTVKPRHMRATRRVAVAARVGRALVTSIWRRGSLGVDGSR